MSQSQTPFWDPSSAKFQRCSLSRVLRSDSTSRRASGATCQCNSNMLVQLVGVHFDDHAEPQLRDRAVGGDDLLAAVIGSGYHPGGTVESKTHGQQCALEAARDGECPGVKPGWQAQDVIVARGTDHHLAGFPESAYVAEKPGEQGQGAFRDDGTARPAGIAYRYLQPHRQAVIPQQLRMLRRVQPQLRLGLLYQCPDSSRP